MRFFTFASLSFLVLLVSAQTSGTGNPGLDGLLADLAKLPSCVTNCVTENLPLSKCALGDLACLCKDTAYAAGSEQCIAASCTIKEALLAQRWEVKNCPVPEHNAGVLTFRLGIALLVISAGCVGCRFLARWRINNSSIGLDDWSILVAYLLMIPATVLIILMTQNGMGRDIWNVSFDNITMMLKVFYMEQFFYQVVVTLTKISIVLLYLRIFPKEISRTFTYVSWAVIAGLLVYLLAFVIYFVFECRPISYFWNQWDGEHEGYCNNFGLASYINGGANIFFDLVVFFLPIPKLMKLKVRDKKRKAGVILTFLLGLFVTACSVIRLTYLASVGKYTNATYHYNDVGFWTGLEAYLGIICACMPTIIGPLMHFFRDTIGSKLSYAYGSYGSSSGTRSGARSTSKFRVHFSHDESVARLPSTSLERGEEVELEKHAQKPGETGTEGKSWYIAPSEHSPSEQASLDDESVYQNGPRVVKGRHGV